MTPHSHAPRRGRPRNPHVQPFVDKFVAMRPTDSVFVEGAKREDVEFIRRPCVAAGIRLTIREVETDEIYQVPGVRVWREEGEYDEL